MRQALSAPTGEPTKVTYIFTTALLGLINRQRPQMLAVVMDSKGPTFRHGLYPAYKANRPLMPQEIPVQVARIEQILDAMRIPILQVEGYEADDIIGTVAKKAVQQGYECYICSKDKDALQLLSKGIYIFDVKTDTVLSADAFQKEYGISPQQYLDCLALQGDPSDNVPGVPDVGPKTALEWIRRYGSIDGLYRHADQIPGKRGQQLRQGRGLVELSRQLVTIDCDVPLEIDWERLRLRPFDMDRLARIFNELGFHRLTEQLGLDRVTTIPASPAGPDSIKTVPHDYQLIDTPERFMELVQRLRAVDTLAVDTETHSLEPMRADLVGISLCWHEHQAYYIPIKGPLGARCLPIEQVRTGLGPILADPLIRKVGQNIKYDMLVLLNAGMPLAGVWFDTMVASYCLEPTRQGHSLDSLARDLLNYRCIPITDLIGKGRKAVTFDLVDSELACQYSGEDADITFQIHKILKSRLDQDRQIGLLFEQVEMPLVEVLAQMEYNGVAVDLPFMQELARQMDEAIVKVTQRIYELAGGPFNIDSSRQLAEVLFNKLGLKPIRIGKTGLSTDAAVLEELSGVHPIIEQVLQYRQLAKLKGTYVDKLAALVNPRTGRVHTSFNQTVTATGRLSSSDPNLQNIPVRTELGKAIRSAFIAQRPEDCLLSADYSQIELRILAHLSQDKALMEAFAAGQDIHRFVASQIYNVPMDQVTDQMRSRCKAVNFGIIYGQGPAGLARTTGLPLAEARRFIREYFARYSSIRQFMDTIIQQAARDGYVQTIMHRRRPIPEIASSSPSVRARAARLAVNTVIQGSAADLIKVAMIKIHKRIQADRLPVRMILQVHDELVFELPADQVDQHGEWISQYMSSALDLSVPLKVDLHHGRTWLG
jgi:DNA polymerase-1